jgi:hypothetical protein
MRFGGDPVVEPYDSETAEILAFALRGRADVLLELSEVLPRLSASGQLEHALSAWIREQLGYVRAETKLLAAAIADPQA